MDGRRHVGLGCGLHAARGPDRRCHRETGQEIGSAHRCDPLQADRADNCTDPGRGRTFYPSALTEAFFYRHRHRPCIQFPPTAPPCSVYSPPARSLSSRLSALSWHLLAAKPSSVPSISSCPKPILCAAPAVAFGEGGNPCPLRVFALKVCLPTAPPPAAPHFPAPNSPVPPGSPSAPRGTLPPGSR